MTAPNNVTIELAGRTWSGSWHMSGRTLHVSSAYGSKATQLGGLKAEQLAAMLLRELVAEWQRSQ